MAKPVAVEMVLQAVDKATAPVRQVQGAFRRLRGQMSAFGARNLGFVDVRNSLHRVGGAIGAVKGRLAGLAPMVRGAFGPLLGLGGALSVAGIAGLIRSVAGLGDAAAKQARKLGLSVEALQEYRHVADKSGVATSTMEMAMQRLNRRMADAAAGKNKDVAGLFSRLGVSLRNADGSLRSTADVMPELAEAFKRIENPALRTRMAFALFDSEGVDLVKMLTQGSGAMQATRREAHELGLVLSRQDAAAAEAFTDRMTEFTGVVRGLGQSFAADLLPVIGPVLQNLKNLILENRDQIIAWGQSIVTPIVQWVQGLNWQEIGAGIKGFTEGVRQVISEVGGFRQTLIAVLVIMNAGLIVSVGKLGWTFGALGASVAAAAGKMALWYAGLMIQPVLSFFTAMKYGIGIMQALKIAIMSNPIGLLVTALTAAAVLIVTNWETVKETLANLFEPIKPAWNAVVEWMAPVVDKIKAIAGPIMDIAAAPLKLAKSLGGMLFGGDEDTAMAEDRAPSPRQGRTTRQVEETEPGSAAPAARPGHRQAPAITPPPSPARAMQQALQALVTVRFEGAPTGMRVQSQADPGLDLRVEQRVGVGLAGAG